MTNLLRANFFRLRKNFLFWGTLALNAAFGAAMCVARFQEHRTYGFLVSLDSVFFGWAMSIGLLLSIFIPLFFGTEYSDGAIRNKMVLGHSRVSIYLANFLTGFAAALAFNAAYMLASALVGIPLIGWLTADTGVVLLCTVGAVVMTAAYCAIFTLITMLLSRKAAASVMAMTAVLLLFVAAVSVSERLNAPPEIVFYSLSIDGEPQDHLEPNPLYLEGAARAAYEFVSDLLPTGQSNQYANLTFARPGRMMALSAALTALFTGTGIFLFRRKDLK